jgi:hypothetical protein
LGIEEAKGNAQNAHPVSGQLVIVGQNLLPHSLVEGA